EGDDLRQDLLIAHAGPSTPSCLGDLGHNVLSDHLQVVDARLHIGGQAVDGEADVLDTNLLARPQELFDAVLGGAVHRPVVQGDVGAELQRHHGALLHTPAGIVGERPAEIVARPRRGVGFVTADYETARGTEHAHAGLPGGLARFSVQGYEVVDVTPGD